MSFLTLSTLLMLISRALATCYFADGLTEAHDDVPCDSSAAVSHCCNAKNFCMDNGLCLLHGFFSRGSCTDPNWGPPCNKVCEDFVPDNGVSLAPCGGDNVFACDLPVAGQDPCVENFTVPGGAQIVLRVDQVLGLGIGTAVTLGATATVPASSCVATVTAGLRFSTVSPDSFMVVSVPLLTMWAFW